MLAGGLAHAQDEAYLFQQINGLRQSLGVAPYQRNSLLDAAAARHARWMVDNGKISHSGVGGSTPRTRAQQAGYGSQWVSENIYGGTNASASVAWAWWLNSPVHYRGITSPNYNEIGIGSAGGPWGSAYVLLFGNSTGQWSIPSGAIAANSPANTGSDGGAAAVPPPFVVGADVYGNIMHEVQPGDTLGDIALMYGYTWDDLPYMLDINGMDAASGRTLEIGAVFLVPPQDGTYTPTPGDPTNTPTSTDAPPTETPTASDGLVPAVRYTDPAPTATSPPTTTPRRVATGGAPLDLLRTATPAPAVGLAPTHPAPPTPARALMPGDSGRPWWLLAAVVGQVVVVAIAGWEMLRRGQRK